MMVPVKRKLVSWIHKLPIVRGLIDIHKKNEQRINRLEKENEILKKNILDLQRKLQKSDEWIRRTRDDMWMISKNVNRTNERVSDVTSNINNRVANLNSEMDKRYTDVIGRINKIKYDNKDLEYKLNKYMPEERYAEALSDWYYNRTSKKLDLNNPQTFNEKIQWLKLYDSTELKTRLADKYLVRDYVSEMIGDNYLIPLLGVYDDFDDIDFDDLPDRFVMKANHGSSWNIIVENKKELDIEAARTKFNKWMRQNYAYNGGMELHYKDINPKIIIEQYIEGVGDLRDYKFLCFGGKIECVWVDSQRYVNHCRDFFDLEWNHLDVEVAYPNSKESIEKPDSFDKMIELTKKLCGKFPFVRVDLYNVGGKIYFGEMTFTPGNGSEHFSSEDYENYLGSLISLPKE